MKSIVGGALVALAAFTAPALAQTPAAAATEAAAPADAKAKGVRYACKQEAVTGSFTRKARQCRHAVGAPKRDTAAAQKPAQPTAAQPAAAAPATPPAGPSADVEPAANNATGL